MKSFFLPVGHSAGASLTTVVSALSCGAALPVTGLDILHISDREPDPVLPSLIRDMNQACSLLNHKDNHSLFPSSFQYDCFRPSLPSAAGLSKDASSAAILDALRGKGIPLSYKTDREAVEWAFSVLLSAPEDESSGPFFAWIRKIRSCISAGEPLRIAVCCDLCDPFSAGSAFALLRFLKDTVQADPSCISLFCLGTCSDASSSFKSDVLSSSLHALAAQDLIAEPDRPGSSCADSVWLLALPSSLVRSEESLRILYAVLARRLASFFVQEKLPAPGLHTVSIPGILTFQSLGDQASSFAAFLHAASWLLSDLIPAFRIYCSHPAAFRSLAPNTRNGLFRKLIKNSSVTQEQTDMIAVLDRSLRAVLSEVLALIRFLPDPLRLAEVSDPLWQQIVDACGKTVTVASEYAVSHAEAEEGGFLGIKPVHRVSMADTEEEKADQRLEDIAVQLKEEEEGRNRLFDSAGFWALLALRDCRSRCIDALNRAREQQDHQSAAEDHYSAAMLARRIRLLEAAVARCDEDLSDPDLFTGSSADSSGSSAPDGMNPMASQLLNADAAEKLSALLVSPEDVSEPLRREIMALMPSLLFGYTLSDTKTLFRKLLASCSQDPSAYPLITLILSALNVSTAEVLPLRFLSAGNVPPIPLLPDLRPSFGPLLTVSSLLPLLPESSGAGDPDAEKRGLLAMLLLRQYRRRYSDESSLSMERFSDGDSPILHAWLSSRSAGCVWILSLGREEERLPFALILPGRDLVPARISASHAAFLPAFSAPWFDPEKLSFRDPCRLLGEGDRTVLLDRLKAMAENLPSDNVSGLSAFLESFLADLETAADITPVPDRLDLRLKSAFGLRLLPAFQSVLVRKACSYEQSLVSDDIVSRLMDRPSFPPFSCQIPDDIVYLYRDVPFARENTRTLLEAIPLPAEKWILTLLDQECRTLSRASDDYHDALVRELSRLLERYPDALPEARQIASDVLDEAGAPVGDTETELNWPWDVRSPSVLTILSESLGNDLAAAAVCPFSDMLTLFPARGRDVIGDSLMASMCLLPALSVPEDQENQAALLPDAVLPPLSAVFCETLCRLPEGRTLLRQNLISFDRNSDAIRVTLTLEGSFTVRMTREYTEEEILYLYSHDIPTLAVWPNLPFALEDWHAYFVYASLPSAIRMSVFNTAGETLSPEDTVTRSVCRSGSFPLSFSFMREEKSIGSLPNVLPAPVIDKTEAFTACIDFGSVGTSVVFSVGRQRRPLQGPTLVRTLLNNPALSRDLLRKEFLPAVPVSALLPTASRLFRNVPGAAPLPFEDGIVLMSSDMQDVLSIPSGTLYTCLKWEEEKGRSVTLCLHQIMLMTALQARSDGASSLLWRFSVPDEMAKEGRERLIALFASLAETVCRESGFPAPDKQPLITFAAESSALGAYFRLCASEDTRGGFMVLDIGACTADISLFLRGREQAVRTCQIPLGVHYMLLPSLLRDPSVLQQDLGFIEDPSFCRDLTLLEQIIRNAKADSSALRHSRLALDSFIADRYAWILPALLQNPLSGMPGRLGSVLLLHYSYLMMLSGLILLQIAADPGKNDFLPEQMSLCLSGRGALLPEGLPDQYKTSLWHFLTMFRNRRVSSLSMLFSSEKKMEIPVGLSVLQEVSADLPPASVIPAAISVRPEELLPQFVLRFVREFPASAEILFHGFFTGDFYHPFTPYGESVISEAIAQSFTEQTALRPFDALSAWIGSLLEQIDTAVL